MVVLSLLLLVVASVFGGIKAETQELTYRAESGDLFLIQNGAEYWYKSFYQAIPYSEREVYHLPEFDTYELYGKKYAPLKGLPQSPVTQIQTGNEVGDPLFQEISPDYKGEPNRTPMTEGVVYTPQWQGWKAYVGIEQVDHFNSGDLPTTKGARYTDLILNRTEPTFVASEYAWFGENYPQYSSTIVGGEKKFNQGVLQSSYRTGWLWLNLKGSGRLLPYSVRIAQTKLEVDNWRLLGRFHWKRYLGDDTLAHTSSHISDYSLEYHKKVTDKYTHRIGVDFSMRGRDEIIEYRDPFVAIPYVNLSFSDKKSITMNNTFAFNGSYFLLQDSIRFTINDTLSGVGLQVHVSNKVNPREEYRELATIGFSDTVNHTVDHLMQVYAGESFYGQKIGRVQWQSYVSPWLIIDPIRFQLRDTVYDEGYLLRMGDYGYSRSTIWGIKSSLNTTIELPAKIVVGQQVRYQKTWGAESDLEVVEPEFIAKTTMQYSNSLGLSMYYTLQYRSVSYIQHWTNRPFKIASGFEHSLTIEQRLIDNNLACWLSALNIGSEDSRHHPNGVEDRFRIIVGARWDY